MSSESPAIDELAAHRCFSVSCFNAVWQLLEQANRSAAENEKMVALAHASVWHWSQRPDVSPRNQSIGYWQLSRVYATIGLGNRALHYAELCLQVTPDEEPFYRGYAYEALARAAIKLNQTAAMQNHLQRARELAAAVTDAEEQRMLLADLDSVSPLSK